VPSLTLMTMLVYVPKFAALGVPVSAPLAALKLAQTGLPVMAKTSRRPLGSLAVGWKE